MSSYQRVVRLAAGPSSCIDAWRCTESVTGCCRSCCAAAAAAAERASAIFAYSACYVGLDSPMIMRGCSCGHTLEKFCSELSGGCTVEDRALLFFVLALVGALCSLSATSHFNNVYLDLLRENYVPIGHPFRARTIPFSSFWRR